MEQHELESVAGLITKLKNQREWVKEINNLREVVEQLDKAGKVTSTRELARLLNKSKSWMGVSLLLVKGFKLYPEIEKFSNRNRAYQYFKRKQKMRRFLES